MTDPQPQQRNRRRRRWTFAILWVAGLYWLALFIATHWPNAIAGLDHGHLDKVAHFAAFGGLALIVATAWASYAGRLTAQSLVALVLVLALYGAVDELLQPPMGRNCSFYDWFADVAGTITGTVLFAVVVNRFFRVVGTRRPASQTNPVSQTN